MPSRVPAVHYTEARHSSMRTSLSSTGVSWRLLMRYPSYARNRANALPSPSPLHYVMAKIVPAVQLAAHAKSNTLYSRSYGRTSKFFRLDGLLLCRIIMGLCFASCELRYKGTKVVIITEFINMTVPCKLFFPNCFFLPEAEFNYILKEIVLVMRNCCITISEIELVSGELSHGAADLCIRSSCLKICIWFKFFINIFRIKMMIHVHFWIRIYLLKLNYLSEGA